MDTINNEHKIRNIPFIKIVNLERRPDRKLEVENKLIKVGYNNGEYEFIKAVDGKKLEPTQELHNLFKDNNRRGVVGCALSHYYLWQQLLKDTDLDYYVILEDDIEIVDNFKDILAKNIDEIAKYDYTLIGYHMFSCNRERVKHLYNAIPTHDNIKISQMKTAWWETFYMGGTFSYVINKNGAQILCDYIKENGIRYQIDCYIKDDVVLPIITYEMIPQIVFSDWNEGGKQIDTDIQSEWDCIDFTKYKEKDMVFIFTNIYDKSVWGNDNNSEYNGSSGNGNEIDFNKLDYIPFVKNFIIDKNIKTVVDIECGSFKCGGLIYNDLDVKYTGYDCYNKLITYNSKQNPSEKYAFRHLDFYNQKDEIVNGDLCILQNVMQHWSVDIITSMLDYFVENKKFKYILICNCCYQSHDNDDIETGGFRPLRCDFLPLKKYNPIKLFNYGRTKEVSIIECV